jgi:hypothetical protein
MVIGISFTVKTDERKWNDQINKLETMEMDLRKRIATDIEQVAITLVNQARDNAHVITGAMRNSITYRPASEGAVTVAAEIDYAIYENARGDPHNFFDRAVETVTPQFFSIIQRGVKAVVDSKKI